MGISEGACDRETCHIVKNTVCVVIPLICGHYHTFKVVTLHKFFVYYFLSFYMYFFVCIFRMKYKIVCITIYVFYYYYIILDISRGIYKKIMVHCLLLFLFMYI